MRFRTLGKWDDRAASKGLIYVAQLIDELLFDFTLDSYKPSAMNTALLIKEAADTVKSIKAGIIKSPNLAHIIDELCLNLSKDEVAKSLISVDLRGINATLKNPKIHENSKSTVIDLLKQQLPLKIYKKKNEDLLIQELGTTQDISKLRTLTRSYITTLLNSGYSADSIRQKSQKFFFYSNDRISNNEAIIDYFEMFATEPALHTVFYRAPEHIREFVEPAKRLGIHILDAIENQENNEAIARFSLRAGEVYLKLEKIPGRDPSSVKSAADSKVEALQTLIGLYHHKESPARIHECLVSDEEGTRYTKVSKTVHPMHKCQDSTPTVASKRLAGFIKTFTLEQPSFRKFHRSAELHSLALSSDSLENQMINLWIALESLIPSSDNETSQIVHLSDSVMPFLNIIYIEKLLVRFFKDLMFWNRRLAKNLFRRVEASGIVSKLSRLLSLEEYQDLRQELENSFGDFHLLKDRYLHLTNLLSSPKNIVSTLESHKTRVDWQLRRIYRARNMIVHEGQTPSYTEILVENTHDYLDTIMNALMLMASKRNTIFTVAQGFKMMELNYNAYHASLNEKNAEFTRDNIDHLLLRFSLRANNSSI